MRIILFFVFATMAIARNPGPGYLINLARPPAVALSAIIQNGLDDYWRCPPSTDYVLLPVGNQKVGDPNSYTTAAGFIANFRIMGCCQPNSFGCISDKNSRIQGCCPNGQVCCYDPIGIKIGCANNAHQCCQGSICPEGYGCCKGAPLKIPQQAVPTGSPTPLPQVFKENYTGRSSCCVLPMGADINDPSTYCEINATTKEPQGCLLTQYTPYDYCPLLQYANYVGFTPTNPNAFVFDFPVPCSSNIAQDSIPLCANYTIKCPSISDCSYVQTVSSWPYYNETSGITTFELMNQSQIVGCCPSGTNLCHGTFGIDVFAFGGCANPLLNETCCGRMICPNATQCCMKTITTTKNDPATNLPVRVTFDIPLGCCPPDLDCCTFHARSNGRRNAFVDPFYCGQKFNGQECALNNWQEPFWYNEIQTQDYGLINGVTP